MNRYQLHEDCKILSGYVYKENKPQIINNWKYSKSWYDSNGFYSEVYKNENNIIIANQNARNDEFNRFFQGNILYGTFIVVSLKKNRRTSMKKKDIRKFSNMFKLSKHQKKIERFKEEFLEEYYYQQRKIKQKNRKHNKEVIFKNAA